MAPCKFAMLCIDFAQSAAVVSVFTRFFPKSPLMITLNQINFSALGQFQLEY